MNSASWLGVIGLGLQILWWFLSRNTEEDKKRKEAVNDAIKANEDQDGTSLIGALSRLRRLS